MGLLVFYSLFVLGYILFVVRMLHSARKQKGKNNLKFIGNLVLVFLISIPLWQYLAGKLAMEIHFIQESGFQVKQKPSFQEYLVKSQTGIELEMLNDIKTEKMETIELTNDSYIIKSLTNSYGLNLPKSNYYRITNKTSENCIWGNRDNNSIRNILNCFNITSSNTQKSNYTFIRSYKKNISILPIRHERIVLIDRTSGDELASFNRYEFYRFSGSIFGGDFYPNIRKSGVGLLYNLIVNDINPLKNE